MHSAKKSRRVDGVATREQLMITAERLFARRGYAGVSLAEIGAAAGQSNKMVVPYYFGSKDGLIDAIFERRIEWLEERRKQGIDAATLEGELDLRTRSEEHTSELQSLMRISYAVFCLKKKTVQN